MDADSNLKPSIIRPRVLRNRSQSAVTKTTTNDAESDASKHAHRHRHTHSHHHISIPHPSRRLAKDFLGFQNGNSSATSDLVRERGKVIEAAARAPSAATSAAANSGQVTDGGRREGQAVGKMMDSSGRSKLSLEEVDRIVVAEAGKSKARQSEIHDALQALSEQSMKFTRELDNGFYSLLEKLTGLRATLHNLEKLSTTTAQLHDGIRADTKELGTDVRNQIGAFGGFKAQEVKLNAMQARVKDSKRKADGLSERLETAKRRVCILEDREREWQESVNWRLRWMWIFLGTIAGIIVAGMLLQHFGPYRRAGQQISRAHKVSIQDSLAAAASIPSSEKSWLEDVLGEGHNMTDEVGKIPKRMGIERSGDGQSPATSEMGAEAEDTALQRLFDEL